MKGRDEPGRADWRGCRVLITGSTGLLGSKLGAALAERGAEVVGLAPSAGSSVRDAEASRTTEIAGQVQDEVGVERVLAEHRPHFVFHLAARARSAATAEEASRTFDTNVRGTWCVLEACRKTGGIRGVLVASSAAVYGPSDRPRAEGDALSGQSLYEVSKACADALARAFERTHSLPVAIVRSVNLYGPGDLDWSRLIPGTIRSVWRGERPQLRSNGSPRAEYLHVDEAVDGWLGLAAAMGDPGVRGAFNLGTGIPFSVLEVVREVLEVMGSEHLEPGPQELGVASGGDRLADSTRARETFGWEPRRTLRQGLIETVAWYSRHLDSAAASDKKERRTAAEA